MTKCIFSSCPGEDAVFVSLTRNTMLHYCHLPARWKQRVAQRQLPGWGGPRIPWKPGQVLWESSEVKQEKGRELSKPTRLPMPTTCPKRLDQWPSGQGTAGRQPDLQDKALESEPSNLTPLHSAGLQHPDNKDFSPLKG